MAPEDAAAAYDIARGATREFHALHGDKTPTAAALKPGPFGGGHATPSSGVLPLYFKPGPGGAEAIQNLISVVGPSQAESVVRGQAAASLRTAAVRNGQINVNAWRKWLNDHTAALAPFPNLRASFARPANAQAVLDNLSARHVQDTADFQRSALGDWMKADPDKAVASLFSGSDRVTRAKQLATALHLPPPNVATAPTAAQAGLRRAVWDEFMRRTVPGYGSADATEVRFSPQVFQNTLRDNRAMLGTILDSQQMRTLQGIGASLAREQRVMNMVRERVGSNTARDARLVAQMEGQRNLAGMALSGALDAAATGAATAAHGVGSGVAAHTAVRGIAAVGDAIRRAGVGRRNDLISRMYADPAFARAMFQRPSVGAARMVARALSQSAPRAVMAAVTQQP